MCVHQRVLPWVGIIGAIISDGSSVEFCWQQQCDVSGDGMRCQASQLSLIAAGIVHGCHCLVAHAHRGADTCTHTYHKLLLGRDTHTCVRNMHQILIADYMQPVFSKLCSVGYIVAAW